MKTNHPWFSQHVRTLTVAALFITAVLITTMCLKGGFRERKDVGPQKAPAAGESETSPLAMPVPPTGPPAPVSIAGSTTVPNGAGGYIVYRDPRNAQFTPPPPNAPALVITGALANAFSTSSEDLQPVPSPVPGGGMMLDLKGRFQQGMMATVDATGKVSAECQAVSNGPAKDATRSFKTNVTGKE